MRDLREKLSVTKLVFLIVMICLCIFTGYQYRLWQEITIKLRETVVTAIVSFYFWQKVWEAQRDPLINSDEKADETGDYRTTAIWFNVDSEEEDLDNEDDKK